MKKNKILILLIILFLMTGCQAEYNLTIDNDTYTESINMTVDNDDTYNIQNLKENNQYISSSSTNGLIYEKTIEENYDNTIFNYKHSFSFDEFRGTLNGKCFNKINLTESDGIYSLYASDFICYGEHEQTAESYKINIKTNYNVINNNADEVNNNVYTWMIDKNNYSGKTINFQYSKQEVEIPVSKNVSPYLISAIVSVLIFISFIFMNKYKNNNN